MVTRGRVVHSAAAASALIVLLAPPAFADSWRPREDVGVAAVDALTGRVLWEAWRPGEVPAGASEAEKAAAEYLMTTSGDARVSPPRVDHLPDVPVQDLDVKNAWPAVRMSRSTSARDVVRVRNSAAAVARSYRQATHLYLPRSMARIMSADIVSLLGVMGAITPTVHAAYISSFGERRLERPWRIAVRGTLAALLAPALLVATVPVTPARTEEPNRPIYYPTQKGAKWVYEETDWARGAEDVVEVVTGVDQKGGGYIVAVSEERGGKLKPVTRLSVSRDGLERLEWTGFDVKGPVRLLKLPAKAGEKWEAGDDEKSIMTARGLERVEVPAGTYTAARVDVSTSGPAGPLQGTLWYAPGVGLVKLEVARAGKQVKGRVLKSFTPGKD